MRYPVNDWSKWYIAQGFGNPTSYGVHEGSDINLKTGGDSDLGQPLYAIANGKVSSVHLDHPTTGFGNHIHIRHNDLGVWTHYAHCVEILVSPGDDVKEGQCIAKLGKSGNSPTAHLHFAIKKGAPGIDAIAKTKAMLDEYWVEPISFIESRIVVHTSDVPLALQKYSKGSLPDLVTYIDQLRTIEVELTPSKQLAEARGMFIESIAKQLNCANDQSVISTEIAGLLRDSAIVEDAQKAVKEITELKNTEISGFQKQVEALNAKITQMETDHGKEIKLLKDQVSTLSTQVNSSVITQKQVSWLEQILKGLFGRKP